MENKSFNSASRTLSARVTMQYITLMLDKELDTDQSNIPYLIDGEAKFFNDRLEQCVHDWSIVPEYLPSIVKRSNPYTYMNGILLSQKGKERLLLMQDGSFAEVDLDNHKPKGLPKKIDRADAVIKYANGQSEKLANLIDSTLNAINKSIADAYRAKYGDDRSGQYSELYRPR